jgi:hypothetical protein
MDKLSNITLKRELELAEELAWQNNEEKDWQELEKLRVLARKRGLEVD